MFFRVQILFPMGLALCLAACGGQTAADPDKISAETSIQLYGAKVAVDSSALPLCDSTQQGQLFYVLTEKSFVFCTSDSYQKIDLRGEAGAVGEDGLDGTNGANGTNGSNGSDGSSCSVSSDSAGNKTIRCEDGTSATLNEAKNCLVESQGDGSFDLTCAGTTVNIRNGVDGSNGADGENGSSCSVYDDGSGMLTQTCTDGTKVTWPKALCGTKAFDPATEFCHSGVVVEQLCNGRSYDTSTRFCYAGVLASLCGGLPYALDSQFCDPAQNVPITAWSPQCLSPGKCGTFLDSRETPAKRYKWTVIGTQTWMAENLNYGVGNVGVCYNNLTSNCDIFGKLYNWIEAMAGGASSNAVPSGVQGICPTGWHLPSDAEWVVLENTLGKESAGKKLKSPYEWDRVDTLIDNSSGFSALPGGRWTNNTFRNLGYSGDWWSSTSVVRNGWENPYSDALLNDTRMVGDSIRTIIVNDLYYAYSIRCVKD